MKPFLSGRQQVSAPPLQTIAPLPKDALRVIGGHGHQHRTAGGVSKSPASGGPTVDCVKQGDKVVRLVVTCSCGEKIEIDCLYPGVG